MILTNMLMTDKLMPSPVFEAVEALLILNGGRRASTTAKYSLLVHTAETTETEWPGRQHRWEDGQAATRHPSFAVFFPSSGLPSIGGAAPPAAAAGKRAPNAFGDPHAAQRVAAAAVSCGKQARVAGEALRFR